MSGLHNHWRFSVAGVKERGRVRWGNQESWGSRNWDGITLVMDGSAVPLGTMGLLHY